MSHHLFRDRRDAGRHLASLLDRYRARQRGVAVAHEVARALGAPAGSGKRAF